MNVNDLIMKIATGNTYSGETPRERHRREIAAEVLDDAYKGKGISDILTSGNVTGRTKFLRLRQLEYAGGKREITDKWVYTNSMDKLLVYITEVVLRYYLCRVLNISFNDSLKRSLIDLVTKYEIANGDHETVIKLENLVFDEYDMVSSPDTPTEKKVMSFINRYNEAVKAVVKDKKVDCAILLDCTRNMPECISERKASTSKNEKVKSA